jgi:hypothetical protein
MELDAWQLATYVQKKRYYLNIKSIDISGDFSLCLNEERGQMYLSIGGFELPSSDEEECFRFAQILNDILKLDRMPIEECEFFGCMYVSKKNESIILTFFYHDEWFEDIYLEHITLDKKTSKDISLELKQALNTL